MPIFIRKPTISQVVEAEQLGPGAQRTVQGSRPPKPGEWVVTDHATGEQWIMSPEEFVNTYDALPVPASAIVDTNLLLAQQGPPQPAAQGMTPEEMDALESGGLTDEPQTFSNTGQPEFSQPNAPTGNTEFGLSEADTMSRPPESPGAGDRSPLEQPIVNDLEGRPATTATQGPRLGQGAEEVPIDTPSGAPAPGSKPDEEHRAVSPEHSEPAPE